MDKIKRFQLKTPSFKHITFEESMIKAIHNWLKKALSDAKLVLIPEATGLYDREKTL